METCLRLFRAKDKRYKHYFHVAVSLNGHLCDKFANFGFILKIYLATVARLSYDRHETFVRVSHDVPTNVALVSFSLVRQSRDIRCLSEEISLENNIANF